MAERERPEDAGDERGEERADAGAGEGSFASEEARRAALDAGREVRLEEERLAQAGIPDAAQESASLDHRGVPDASDIDRIAPGDVPEEAPDNMPSEENLAPDEAGGPPLAPVEGERPNVREGEPVAPRPGPEVVSLDDLDPDVVEQISDRAALVEPVAARELEPEDEVGARPDRDYDPHPAPAEPLVSELVEPTGDEGAYEEDEERAADEKRRRAAEREEPGEGREGRREAA